MTFPRIPPPDPAPVEPFVALIEVQSVTTQLRKLFTGDIVIKPSTSKSGLHSCQGKYSIDGLTEKQVRAIAKVIG